MLAIYASMIYTASCIMFLMRADTLQQVGGGWPLEIESFLGPVKWHRANIGECHLVPKKLPIFDSFWEKEKEEG
jgi:hypothetical protein